MAAGPVDPERSITPEGPAGDGDGLMTSQAFRHWRRGLGLSQAEAAAALGLGRRMIQYYERGDRAERTVVVPRAVRLACWALTQGVVDYDGAVPRLSARSAPD
jgi:transcriptional regulator with XRE-family HTH domain